MKKKQPIGFIFALIAGICWGFSGTVGEYLFSHSSVNNGWLTAVRLLSSGAILLIISAVREPASVAAVWKDRRDALHLISFGIAGLMAVQYCYMEAIYYSNSGTATAVQYSGEALLLIYTCFRARRLPKASEFLGLLLALLGIFLLATHGRMSNMVLSPQGLFWGLAAALALVVYTVSPGKLIQKYGNAPVVAYGMLIGGTVLAILVRVWQLPGVDSMGSILALATIVLVGTVLGFSLYLESTVLIGPLKAGLIASVETLSAPFFSRIWLKTQFELPDYIGFVCIMAMVAFISLPELLSQKRESKIS
jgi:drug/metabolite transporter (DMT)-like permease